MIHLILSNSQKKLASAYFLAQAYKGDDCFIPISDETVCSLCEETLNFLKLPYKITPSDEIINSKAAYFSNHDLEYFNAIDESTSLIDIALKKNNEVYYFDNHQVLNSKTATSFNDAYIVSCSSTISDQAVKYSLLTRRPLILINLSQYEVFFTHFSQAKSYFISFAEDLTTTSFVNFIDIKIKSGNDVPSAMMYPYGVVEREFFIIKSYLLTKYPYPYDERFSFHFPLDYPNLNYQSKNMSIFLGKQKDTKLLIDELAEPLHLLFSASHSNGVDMDIGNIVLCPRENKKIAKPLLQKAMPCFFDLNICSRKSTSNEIIHIRHLKTKIAFFYTCWGLLLKGAIYDVTTSFARQIVLSPYIGLFITTYTMSHLDKSIALRFTELCFNNLAVGSIINSLNAEHYKAYDDIPNTLVVLGDPEFIPIKNSLNSMENLFPQKILQYLNKKGIAKHPIIMESKVNIELVNKNISVILSDIIFVKCIMIGSKALPNHDIQLLISKFSAILDDFCGFLLIFKKRIKQEDKQYIDFELFNKKLLEYVNIFHVNLVRYFILLNSSYGGLIRLQVDKYFDETGSAERIEKFCPYCSGYLVKNTFSLIENDQLRRNTFECFNCTTIIDSRVTYKFAIINASPFWQRGMSHKISIQLYLADLALGEYSYTICACLEPFNKKTQNSISFFEDKGSILLNNDNLTSLEIKLSDFTVSEHYTKGQYYLNVLIIFQSSVAVLRRSIYLK